ncbi:MAG TPA: type IV pilus modification protein PilV [Sedimenticola sp.]|nr:type IV pilus modification protein PilV [Sedimenticola sp.]
MRRQKESALDGGRCPVPQQGFTLVEVLVTVVILAVGLLGLAGLQTVSMRNNHSAYQRSQAVQLAYDMADRVRANRKNSANFDQLVSAAHPGCVTVCDGNGCDTAAGCSAAEMAENDLFAWRRDVAALLPAGDAIICLDETPNDGTGSADDAASGCDHLGSTYAVKVWWNDNRAAPGAVPQRFVMSFRP